MIPSSHNYSEFRHLHPLTLVNRIFVSLPALLFLAWNAASGVDAASRINLAVSIIFGMFFIPWILLSYYRFTFRINAKEVTIHSGVVTRQRRNIPIERIQNVEIEQRFIQRILGLAKVTLSTAGSAQAEGVLESVKLESAEEIKTLVRQYQGEFRRIGQAADSNESEESVLKNEGEGDLALDDEAEKLILFGMEMKRVLLAGSLQFSLIYIAFIASTLQLFNIGPEQIFDWFDRGELESVMGAVQYPRWILISFGVVVSVLVGWLTGMLLTINRYYNFELWKSEDKIYKRHGLLTLTEDAIPISKVHALVMVANPMMRFFGWARLEIQTMGVQSGRSGRKVVMPLARISEIESIGPEIVHFDLPKQFFPVSILTIRRSMIRLTVGIVILYALLNFLLDLSWIWIPIMLFAALWYSIKRYDMMGLNQTGSTVFVKYGVWSNRTWMVEKSRIQSLSTSASFFQRRLGLKDLIIDTAGASPIGFVSLPDLKEGEADTWMTSFYAAMQKHLDEKIYDGGLA